MRTESFQPRPGDWVNSASGRPIGRIAKVEGDRMQIVDVDNELLHVDLSRISTTVDQVLVVDCELRSLRALQQP
jgi:hypothetical protein